MAGAAGCVDRSPVRFPMCVATAPPEGCERVLNRDPPPEFLTRPDGAALAYRRSAGRAPGVLFLGGFRSDMTGTKATALEAACRADGRAFLRFDYSGHGESSGDFLDGCIGSWRDDALAALDTLTEGPQVLVGSSMGGWIMLLVALARPDRVAGLLGVAAAPDFTEDLIWARYDLARRRALAETGVVHEPSRHDEAPTPITRRLIEDGRRHLLLGGPIPIRCPVRLLHGRRDADVPWPTAQRIAARLTGADVRVRPITDGDHRLSRPEDIALLCATLREICTAAERRERGPGDL